MKFNFEKLNLVGQISVVQMESYLDYEEPQTRLERYGKHIVKRRRQYSRPKFDKKKFHRIFHKHSKEYQIGDTEELPLTDEVEDDYDYDHDQSTCYECTQYEWQPVHIAISRCDKDHNVELKSALRKHQESCSRRHAEINREYREAEDDQTDDINDQITVTSFTINRIELTIAQLTDQLSLERQKLRRLQCHRNDMLAPIRESRQHKLDEFTVASGVRHQSIIDFIDRKYEGILKRNIDRIKHDSSISVCVTRDSWAMRNYRIMKAEVRSGAKVQDCKCNWCVKYVPYRRYDDYDDYYDYNDYNYSYGLPRMTRRYGYCSDDDDC